MVAPAVASSAGRSASSAGTAELTPPACPAPGTGTPGSPGRLSVEDLLDDAAGVPGGAPVVVEELPGVDAGAVAAGPRDAGQLEPGPRQLVTGPAADEEDGVARAAGQLPRVVQRPGLLRGEQ